MCFDADNDIACYRMMQAWKDNDHHDFNFDNAHELTTIRAWSSEESIKRSLRERLKGSKQLMVLVGKNTRYCQTYVRWEIEQAIEMGLPIIVVNLNGGRSMDDTLCPLILREELAVHIPYKQKIMTHAMSNWEYGHSAKVAAGTTGPHYYLDSVYTSLGL